MLSLFLIGCGLRTPSEKEPLPPEEVSYPRNCLADEACPIEKKEASLLEYVGAVYGDPKGIHYDEKLDRNEREYVTSRFGHWYPGEPVDQYLKLAARLWGTFYPSLIHEQHQCKSKFFTTDTLSYLQLGEAWILGGMNFCPNRFIEKFQSTGLEQMVLSSPDDWVFFLQGNQEVILPQSETIYFLRIAQTLSIPSFPLPDSKLDLAATLEENGRGKALFQVNKEGVKGIQRLYSPNDTPVN